MDGQILHAEGGEGLNVYVILTLSSVLFLHDRLSQSYSGQACPAL